MTVESLQGDLNGDDAVNFDDFLILSENYGKDVPASTNGDLDGDGLVDFGDYLIFRHEFLNAGAKEPSRDVVVSQRRIAPAESSADRLASPQSRDTSNSLPLLLLLDQGGGCPCGGVGCQSCRPDENSTDASPATEPENTTSDLPILSLLDQGSGCPCGGVGCLSCRGW